MYTQCPDCATVFRLSAEILRAAQGEVRCGVCSTTFNALENLSEKAFEPSTAAGPPIKPEDTITVEETPGNEDIELSTSVEILQLDPATPASETPAASEEERAMEFHGNPADLDQLFVQLPQTGLAQFAEPTVAHDDLDRTAEYPVIVLDEDEGEEPEEEEPEPIEIVLEAPPEPNPLENPRILIPDEMRRNLAAEAAARTASPLGSLGFEETDEEPPTRRWPWATGAAALGLLLVAQVVHSQRDELIRKPGIGPLLAGAYSLLGTEFATPMDLSAFELRQLGAANDTNASGRLLLRASLVNHANFAQPFPILRLALQDRYGTTLRVGDIAPADYLPGKEAPSLLDAGGRADAEIHVVDPGPDAVGFEIDVCLRVEGGVRCANQPPATTP